METITGFVEHIVFRNEENGYTVLNLAVEEDEVTCVGVFQFISEGESVELKGEYTVHPSYGPQFQVESYAIKAPQDIVSIERYLGSGAIKGVGAALAARIVRRFKEDTFRIIEEEPERLAEIKGISERKAQEIAEQTEEKRELRQAMIFLQNYGISLTLAVKIYQTYQLDMYRIIQENPYKLAEDVTGVGFKIADEIAHKVGIHMDSDFRIRSGILYVLQQASLEGHTYLPKELLTRRACELLEVDADAVEKHYMDMTIDRKLVMKQTEDQVQIYASTFYYMELNVAVMLRELNVKYDFSETAVEQRIRKIEELSDLKLDEMQHIAVVEAVRSGLLVITGGPGTGKTTTINTIIQFFESEGMDISLAAPTGRAAKRMSETTGYEAKTIHRLLELSGGMDEHAGFERNEQNPLETDVLIIDEMSMVDITLIHNLLKAVVAGTRVILVGDVNQLPSVGPGCVLKDIIDSHACNVVRLNRIFRQASESDIIVNAHKINRGEPVVLDNKSRDFFFLKRYDANVIISICIQLIQQKLPKYVNAEPFDIQVLTPMRKGLLGVERLNTILQQYLNPPDAKKAEHEHGQTIFRVGDKVMQIKNNYQAEWEVRSRYNIPIEKGLGVFNGDMGLVREINTFSETLTVEYEEGRMVEYPFKELDQLELAYAITIHKSQGSEYPAVIIPLLTGPRMLMNRNLLYTAVTRARKCVTLVGDEKAFYNMEANVNEQKRYSGLRDRLEEL
ncbi:MAG: ATP-dependent RecD-like DNA helicase [Lachnospiraceae bacterium]|jgi:exodeoxyribonuclease V alpha subunit|uniref:SF1B family DNA helicase RecD2 n=1 Tax=Clostridia TaxID=186801 RepID=UPI000E54F5FD|nr:MULTISPECIES: ATP-dependent RecD-like DNA helicase [Clostridia]MBS5190177.1 ATP-dependent RecD-like DNA helicase [Lachnospiraceae bacterium]RHV65740.1 ATP-dependent RecD-like DNA helicase [Roseburia sp. OM02-15]